MSHDARAVTLRVALAAVLLLTAAASEADEIVPDLTDPTGDRVLFSVPVPKAERAQGEVRVVERAGGLVVQTLLDTKVMKRVVGQIAEKEAASWPEGSPHHGDSIRYVEALGRIALGDAAQFEGRRRRLLIEFVSHPDSAFVRLARPSLDDDEGQQRLVAAETLEVPEVSRAYVEANLVPIVVDAFGPQSDALRRVEGSAR